MYVPFSEYIIQCEYIDLGGRSMNTYTAEEKYLKVIEALGELLLEKDKTIKLNTYEIEALKKKISNIEQYIDYYSEAK